MQPSHVTYAWSSQATTDSFADLGAAWDKRGQKTATIILNNPGAQSATWQVLGSCDNITYVVEVASAPVASGQQGKANIANYYPFLKVQVKSTAAGTPTNVTASAAAMDA